MGEIDRLPISIKGVVLIGGEVLLARNSRAEWELLGGRLEAGEHPRATLVREVREESALSVIVAESPIDSYVLDVGNQHVFIVAYGCHRLAAGTEFASSAEHAELRLFSVDALRLPDLPQGYASAVRRWTGVT